ncbi:MAG: hypothetical protein Q9190_005234 [Brigantiaea leucoxantha]
MATTLEHTEEHLNPFRPDSHDCQMDDHLEKGSVGGDTLDGNSEGTRSLSIKQRLRHFTWAWFTLPMSTGGIALLLALTPHRFAGLTTIGTVFYILDLSGMQHYGVPSTGPWLPIAVRIIYWIYVASTFLVAVFQYFYLFTAKQLTVQSMTPAWILPIFPVMLSGTAAASIAESQPPSQCIPILVSGFTFQSLGFLVAIFLYSNYIGRMMQSGLPAPMTRGGMFISVGPPCFTGLAYIELAAAVPDNHGFTLANPGSKNVMVTMALMAAIFMWSLAFWFFAISLLGILAGLHEMRFGLIWWAFVFPNVGFAIVTIEIGKQLASAPLLWVGSVMTVILVAMWFFVLTNHVCAVYLERILYPGKDEDAGWKPKTQD